MPHAPAHPTFSEYLTVGEAAKFLGVSPWTLRNWDKAGKLRPMRHPKNGYRIYRQADLEDLLAIEGSTGDARSVRRAADWHDLADGAHVVQFYEADAFLADAVAGFVAGAIDSAADAAIVVAGEARREAVRRALVARGVDVAAALASGRYVVLDAAQTLAAFMVEGQPDSKRFAATVGAVVAQATAGGGRRLRAFGEMVAMLWAEGNRAAAVRLEHLWNELAEAHRFALLCAYPMAAFGVGDAGAFADVCGCHSRVIPAESYAGLRTADERSREVARLQHRARAAG
jgi:excisionase family DNA binding protein